VIGLALKHRVEGANLYENTIISIKKMRNQTPFDLGRKHRRFGLADHCHGSPRRLPMPSRLASINTLAPPAQLEE
jgi:hypothetical protein